MKRLFLFLFLFIPIFIDASTYDSSIDLAGTYMDSGDYKFSYEKYIYTPTNNSSFYNNDSSAFIKGGMLNLEEFKITLKNSTRELYYSYLYEGNPFWTITQGSSSTKRKVIEHGYTEYNTNQSYPHIDTKITEYVLPTASIVGQGTYNDPFIFAPQYKVMIKVNNSERGVIVNSSNEEVSSIEFLATESDFRQIKIKTKGKYGYIGSTCGTVLNEIQASSGLLVLSGVTRDTECTINFGEKPASIILDQSQNNKIKSNPEKLYIIPEFGWYTDEFANYSLTTLITNPERIGYTYNGYYKSTSVSNACSGTLVIGTDKKLIKTKSLLDSFDANQTLYPCYTANTYTITFDKNTGDELNTTSKQIVFDQNYGELPTPEKTGYTFIGWYTDPEYGEQIESTTKMDEAMNHTLYAHWTPNTSTEYKVKHWLQKVGKGSEQNDTNYTEKETTTHTGTSDTSVTAPRKTYTGFTEPSLKSVTIDRHGTSVVNYYYTRNFYEVTYNLQGIGSPQPSIATVQYQDVYPIPTVSAVGYTFNGWYTAASGGTKVTKTTTLTKASPHTLYAHWTINKYTVTLNKGTGISAVSGAGEFNYNSVRNIDATVAPGYTWTGWTGDISTSTKAYSFSVPAGDVTLTAKATGNPYAVVYNCNNGGQTPPSATNHIYGTASAVKTNTCSKTGFTFTGWNTAANGSGTTVGSGANITSLTTTYNGTVTLYAQWKDTTPPSCSLTASASGVSFSSKTDNVGVSSFGLIKSSSASYNGTSSLGLSTGTFYGYVRDAAGNTSSCNIKIGRTYVSKYSKTTKTCNRTFLNYTRTSKACTRSVASYNKTTQTCSRSVSSYNKTYRRCARSWSHYNVTTKTCGRKVSTYKVTYSTCKSGDGLSSCKCRTNNTPYVDFSSRCTNGITCTQVCVEAGYKSYLGSCRYTYSFDTVWEYKNSCSLGSSFTCNSSSVGRSYVSSCDANSYSYYWYGEETNASPTCYANAITCNSSNYGKTHVACSDQYNYSFIESATTDSSCSLGSSFTCNSSNYGSGYVSSCSTNYNYGFTSSTTTSSSCSKGSSFTCNSSNYGGSYVSACSTNYNYYFDSNTTTASSCTVGSSFDCNSGNYGGSYISSCTANYNYYWADSTTSTSSCSVGSQPSCSSSGNVGGSYVSGCTPTAYACSDSGYTKINNTYCYKR